MMPLFLASGSQRTDLPNPEIALCLAVLALSVWAWRTPIRWLGWWERPLARLARRKVLCILVAAVAPLLLRAIVLPWYPPPEPRLHDEFSFLLAADTFAHGRLVNPQHPFWMHFESMHILATPVYASAFPVAQAMALALGKLLLGHWWAGVWLSAGFMCGAVCWMLQGWLPPRWAFLGSILAIARFGVSSYWMNTYWGGCMAAAGGALVLGALPRIMRAPASRHAVVMGSGCALLANSRPFEGAILSVAAIAVLVAWIASKRGPSWSTVMRQIVVPLALVLAFTAAAMAYYFTRVTGKPWVLPYVLYRSTMTIAPHFLWQSARPVPLYNNAELRHFYVDMEMNVYQTARAALANDIAEKSAAFWRFYAGPLLTIPLIAAVFLWRNRKVRQLLILGAVFPLALVGQVWHNVHYAAPATGLGIALAVLGLRNLRRWPLGLWIVRCLPLAAIAMLLIQVFAGRAPDDLPAQASWRWPPAGGVIRARILRELANSAGQHLVFVRYGRWHDFGDEWVYNEAEIDQSKIVWARELDPGSNAKLMDYFAGRHAWLIEPDEKSPHLTPYRDAAPRPMPFVQIGAPGIAVLRSPEDLRSKVLEKAGPHEEPRNCDVWNYYFTAATGVAGPDVTTGCYPGTDRGEKVSFERWFAWLQRQR